MSWCDWRPKGVKEKVLPFIGSGMTLRAVAEQIGCSHVAVHYALKSLGAKL